jgi:transposase
VLKLPEVRVVAVKYGNYSYRSGGGSHKFSFEVRAMRGPDAMQESQFTVAKLDDFVPADHPLRSIRVLVNDALATMNSRFNEVYADSGRDSIAPQKLIRALLLQVFYSIRSERQLCEQLRYNLLFCWFIGLALDDPIWDHSTFSKNRDRLLAHQGVEGSLPRYCA